MFSDQNSGGFTVLLISALAAMSVRFLLSVFFAAALRSLVEELNEYDKCVGNGRSSETCAALLTMGSDNSQKFMINIFTFCLLFALVWASLAAIGAFAGYRGCREESHASSRGYVDDHLPEATSSQVITVVAEPDPIQFTRAIPVPHQRPRLTVVQGKGIHIENL